MLWNDESSRPWSERPSQSLWVRLQCLATQLILSHMQELPGTGTLNLLTGLGIPLGGLGTLPCRRQKSEPGVVFSLLVAQSFVQFQPVST